MRPLPPPPRARQETLPGPEARLSHEPVQRDKFTLGSLRFELPTAVTTALATALISHFLSPGGVPQDDEIRAQIREVVTEVREVKAAQSELRTSLQIEQAYTARDIPELAQVIEATVPGSAKFQWHEGWRPQALDWSPAPMASSSAARWQPMLALLAPPLAP